VDALGYSSRAFEPQIFFTEQEKDKAYEILGAASRPGQPIAIFITQTSVTQKKSWRPERFRAAADFLVKDFGAHIVFVGTGREAAAIDQLRSGLTYSTTSLAGKTNLSLLAAVMSMATIGLTLDTGPMHIGRAVGLPMVIIAPAWSPPVEWLPLGNPRFRVLKNADMPTATVDYVIDEVSVDEVKVALADLLLCYPGTVST
jgi:ADP-heptose:LPS heptosyltransferase